MRFATYTAAGETFYGAATDDGMIALSPEFPQWSSLYEVVAAGGLAELEQAASDRDVTHSDFDYEMVMPDVRRIVCVGVNFPDRNAEYKDGSAQPKYIVAVPAFCHRIHRARTPTHAPAGERHAGLRGRSGRCDR